MMKVLIILLVCASALAKHEAYEGFKSYFISPSRQEELNALGPIFLKYDVDVLSNPVLQREGVVLVAPMFQDKFVNDLEELGISFRIHSDDVKARLDFDDQEIETRRASVERSGGRQVPYDNYQRLSVILDYMEDVARRYPNIVQLVDYPRRSWEGRPLRYLKISSSNFTDTRKPVIFIDGGVHAREWISPPTVTWAIHKLVEDLTEPDLLANNDWILFPVVNPDGYEFTFTNSRFWRKTRSTNQASLSGLCPGVDGNRNYNFFWNTVGVSSSPCMDTYPGASPFSEVEIQAVRDIVNENLSRMTLYITMHSYGSMILFPWGHDGTLSNNALILNVVGVGMAEAIDRRSLPHFPNYLVGNSVQVIGYAASGAAEDWVHLQGVPLAYTYELPGLDSGFNGFHLNPRYIQQVVIETWDGIAAGARLAGQFYGKRSNE